MYVIILDFTVSYINEFHSLITCLIFFSFKYDAW